MSEIYKRFAGRLKALVGKGQAAQTTSKEPLQVRALPTFARISGASDSLPDRSRKYLLPAPLESGELLTGRDEQLTKLDQALTHWQNGYPTSIALVGPQGCGKTSLINCFLKRLSSRNVIEAEIGERLNSPASVCEFLCRLFGVDPPVDEPEALIVQLMQAEPGVVALEGGHNLLLRVIGGRKAAEAFLYAMLCTRQRHLWLLTCRRFPWGNLDRHVHVSPYFSHVIAVDPLSEDHLREALQLRLEKCGLQVSFWRSKEDTEKGEPPDPEKQKDLEREFYRALLSNSGGNFHAVLYFLLLCSRYDAGRQSLLLWPPEPLDMAFVKKMDRLDQLSLAEIAGHGVLSPEEHARIFRTVGSRSRVIFEQLEQLNLLVPVGEGDDRKTKAYDLSPVIHYAVTSALQQLNLMY